MTEVVDRVAFASDSLSVISVTGIGGRSSISAIWDDSRVADSQASMADRVSAHIVDLATLVRRLLRQLIKFAEPSLPTRKTR